jgi:hypothetical protein
MIRARTDERRYPRVPTPDWTCSSFPRILLSADYGACAHDLTPIESSISDAVFTSNREENALNMILGR